MDVFRGSVFDVATFWFMQGVWVWCITLPATIANASVLPAFPSGTLSVVDHMIALIWAVAFVIEAVADHQKLVFKRQAGSERRWCGAGVWQCSRHPNYWGEVSVERRGDRCTVGTSNLEVSERNTSLMKVYSSSKLHYWKRK